MLSNLRKFKKVEAILVDVIEGDGELYPYQNVTYALIEGKVYILGDSIEPEQGFGNVKEYLLTNKDIVDNE